MGNIIRIVTIGYALYRAYTFGDKMHPRPPAHDNGKWSKVDWSDIEEFLEKLFNGELDGPAQRNDGKVRDNSPEGRVMDRVEKGPPLAGEPTPHPDHPYV
jgi:hypothetical protein